MWELSLALWSCLCCSSCYPQLPFFLQLIHQERKGREGAPPHLPPPRKERLCSTLYSRQLPMQPVNFLRLMEGGRGRATTVSGGREENLKSLTVLQKNGNYLNCIHALTSLKVYWFFGNFGRQFSLPLAKEDTSLSGSLNESSSFQTVASG